MGQKVHPIGFRLGVTKEWQAKWYADKHYTELLQEDLKIRGAIEKKYPEADISRIEIERAANQVTVTVHTARPGIVIGRGGQRVDEMRLHLEQITGKRIRLNIQEIRQPELDAYLVASNIAHQMERRISHRRAMKQAISRAMESGAQGIKVVCSGRLSGSEYARKETLHQGRVPLHTLRADIDYALAEARTTLGRTGVKVWIYKGDILPEREEIPIEELAPGGVAWGEAEVAEAEAAAEGEEGLVAAEAAETVQESAVAAEAAETVQEGAVAAEAVEKEEEVPAAAEVVEKEEEVPAAAEVVEKEEEVPAAAEAVEKEEEVPAAVEAVEKEEEVPAAVEVVEQEEVAPVAEGDDTKQGEVAGAVDDRPEEAPAAESDEAGEDTAPVELDDQVAEDREGEQESNEEAK